MKWSWLNVQFTLVYLYGKDKKHKHSTKAFPSISLLASGSST